jgi:hypothetical protein
MKTKKLCGLAAALALSLMCAGAAFAQDAPKPLDFSSSPAKSATAGRFTSAADDYLDVNYYSGVAFDKFFAYGSFVNSQAGQLGFAKRFGSIYLGAGYVGGMGQNWYVPPPVKKEDNIAPSTPDVWKTVNSSFANENQIFTNLVSVNSSNPNSERVAVLIGAADMGFKLGFATDRKSFKAEDFIFANTDKARAYSEYAAQDGWMIPSLGWGMARDLTANGIRPSVNVDLGFYSHKITYNRYVNWVQNDTTAGDFVYTSAGYLEPVVKVALGGFSLFKGNSGSVAIDASYAFTTRIYNNEYTVSEDGEFKTKKIKGLNYDYGYERTGKPLSENATMTNTITPALKLGYKVSDAVQFKGKISVPVEIYSETQTFMKYDTAKKTLVKDSYDTKSSSLSAAPVIDAAMQYKIFNNKLVFNVGGSFKAAQIVSYTEDASEYTMGVEEPHSKTTQKGVSFNNSVLESLRCGVTWNISDNIGFEAVTGVSASGFELLGSGNSLTSFGSFLATLRF